MENDSKFRDFLNFSLMELWESGDYEKIYNKWLGKDTKYYIPMDGKLEVWPVRQITPPSTACVHGRRPAGEAPRPPLQSRGEISGRTTRQLPRRRLALAYNV